MDWCLLGWAPGTHCALVALLYGQEISHITFGASLERRLLDKDDFIESRLGKQKRRAERKITGFEMVDRGILKAAMIER